MFEGGDLGLDVLAAGFEFFEFLEQGLGVAAGGDGADQVVDLAFERAVLGFEGFCFGLVVVVLDSERLSVCFLDVADILGREQVVLDDFEDVAFDGALGDGFGLAISVAVALGAAVVGVDFAVLRADAGAGEGGAAQAADEQAAENKKGFGFVLAGGVLAAFVFVVEQLDGIPRTDIYDGVAVVFDGGAAEV